jgi:hypothetical protein
MQLKLEKFTRVGGSFSPTVSVRKDGSLGLSQGALNRFNLQDDDWYAVLYYDRNIRIIGIQPTKDSSAEGAIKIIKRKSKSVITGKESVSAAIAARAFFQYYNISLAESKSYSGKWDEQQQMILVNLTEEAINQEGEV